MSRKTLVVCDRCGHEMDSSGFGAALVRIVEGLTWDTEMKAAGLTPYRAADLCPDCYGSLRGWWWAAKEEE